MYRPPNETLEDHKEVSRDILGKMEDYSAYTFINSGDLNFGNIYSRIPTLDPKPLDQDASDLYAAHGLTQLINLSLIHI